MPINATTPTTINETYDRWAISGLQLIGDGCAAFGQATPGPVSIQAALVKARVRTDGVTWERGNAPEDTVRLSIPDLYGYVATNTTTAQSVAAAIGAIVAALEAFGTDEGVL